MIIVSDIKVYFIAANTFKLLKTIKLKEDQNVISSITKSKIVKKIFMVDKYGIIFIIHIIKLPKQEEILFMLAIILYNAILIPII